MSAEIVGRVAIDGHGPPVPFASIDDAAQAGLVLAAPLSSRHEYGGAVIEAGNGGFYATKPVTIHDTYHFAFLLEPGVKLAAIYHAHPPGPNSIGFSAADIGTAQRLRVRSYVGFHGNGAIRYFDPRTMRPRIEGFGANQRLDEKGRPL